MATGYYLKSATMEFAPLAGNAALPGLVVFIKSYYDGTVPTAETLMKVQPVFALTSETHRVLQLGIPGLRQQIIPSVDASHTPMENKWMQMPTNYTDIFLALPELAITIPDYAQTPYEGEFPCFFVNLRMTIGLAMNQLLEELEKPKWYKKAGKVLRKGAKIVKNVIPTAATIAKAIKMATA